MSKEYTFFCWIFDETHGERMGRGRGGTCKFSAPDEATALRKAHDFWMRWPECTFYGWWVLPEKGDMITGDTFKSMLKDYL